MRKKNFYDIRYHKTSMKKKMYDRFISGFEATEVWRYCGEDKLEEETGKPVGMFLWQAIEGKNLNGRKEKQVMQKESFRTKTEMGWRAFMDLSDSTGAVE